MGSVDYKVPLLRGVFDRGTAPSAGIEFQTSWFYPPDIEKPASLSIRQFLLIEILSPDDRLKDLVSKSQEDVQFPIKKLFYIDLLCW